MLVDSIHTLVDVIIVDPTQVDLVSLQLFFEVVATFVDEVKEELYPTFTQWMCFSLLP